jgi:hypothetical protein
MSAFARGFHVSSRIGLRRFCQNGATCALRASARIRSLQRTRMPVSDDGSSSVTKDRHPTSGRCWSIVARMKKATLYWKST